MKYVILIYGNPASRAVWDGFTPEQQAEGLKIYAALNEELRASGEIIVSEALADPSAGRRVMVSDGVAMATADVGVASDGAAMASDRAAMATDGPFAEVKEHLAGFYLLDCASFGRAVEIAGRIPEAGWGMVEVRPVQTWSM